MSWGSCTAAELRMVGIVLTPCKLLTVTAANAQVAYRMRNVICTLDANCPVFLHNNTEIVLGFTPAFFLKCFLLTLDFIQCNLIISFPTPLNSSRIHPSLPTSSVGEKKQQQKTIYQVQFLMLTHLGVWGRDMKCS